MSKKAPIPSFAPIPPYDRGFFESDTTISQIGGGAIGGKASGLAFAHQVIQDTFPSGEFNGIQISIPRFVVIGTDIFDAFIERNELRDMIDDDMADDRLANAFQRAEFPAEFAGDLRSLATAAHTPLAVRSSSMLEDAMYEPFAGVYETKMTPNNQSDASIRYKKLIEAIKFVYASTFFREARAYMKMIGRPAAEEKMAVIIQEIVGHRYDDRFYPTVSGVARSFNYYPFGNATPQDGIIDLALGLGKTIVEGGFVWTYCPAFPKSPPPYSASDLVKSTQTEFWAVNMGKPPSFDPIQEAEFLVKCPLKDSDYDNTLSLVASTYQPQNDRLVPGTGADGPRVLDFAPLLRYSDLPFNLVTKKLLQICSDGLGAAVEIEFAIRLDPSDNVPPHFGFVQVRPMVVSDAEIDIAENELCGEGVLIASDKALGNGVVDDLTDIIFVKPDTFTKDKTRVIAGEINEMNRALVDRGRRCILIGFGRWGSSDPWLGIPVNWSSITGARVLVEATLPDMDIEMSQGSHFFHNLTSLQLIYMCVGHQGPYEIDWEWLNSQETVNDAEFVRHIVTAKPLAVKVDGRTGMGVILT